MIKPANRLQSVEAYYFSTRLRTIAEMEKNGASVINLAIGNPDLPPAPEVIEALCASARREDVHGYQPYRGTEELRQAFASWYQTRYHVHLDPDSEILPLMGSKEGVYFLSMALLDPDDQVLIPDPGYLAYASCARLAGAHPVTYDLLPENGWLPSMDQLYGMDTRRVKMLWLNYPHMPTGALASVEALQHMVDFARERNVLLCHDNPYSLVLNPSNPVSILQMEGAEDCCMELNSLSKSHRMAGWRVGALVGNHGILDAVHRVKSNVDSGMFGPAQHAAAVALRDHHVWPEEHTALYQKRAESLTRLLKTLDCSDCAHQSGLFIWARIPESAHDAEVFCDQVLADAHVFLTPGTVFGRNGSRYVRASLTNPLDRIQEAIHRIQNINITV